MGEEGVGVAGEGILSLENKNETIWRHLKKKSTGFQGKSSVWLKEETEPIEEKGIRDSNTTTIIMAITIIALFS